LSEAYTPGLKIKERILINKERRLPIQGEVLVKVGDAVAVDTVVARALIPGEFKTINAADILKLVVMQRGGKRTCELRKYMLKKEGEPVSEGEVISKRETLFNLLKYDCRSPINGVIEFISDESGQVLLRYPPKPLELKAYVPGVVVKVIPNEGVVIETPAALIQGIFGVGGERNGELMFVNDSPDATLKASDISERCRGKVIVGGALVEASALKAAEEVGVAGVVVGGIIDRDLVSFVGQEIGVAVTGREKIGLTLILTEGFGKLSMAKKTFDILKEFDGKPVSIDGATQIRAGVIRPEIIVPRSEPGKKRPNIPLDDGKEYAEGLKAGTLVRIIRQPFFGSLARVIGLPVSLQKMETESKVRVLEVELQDGKLLTLPRANVEIFEE
jgi:hypothetical protein